MKRLKALTLSLGLLSSPVASAQASGQLFFPVEKSNVKILPQRFEYALLNKDQIKVGNMLIDANQMDFQLIPVGNKENLYRLRFRWPADVLTDGEIAIKDNSGKGIWFQKIQKDKLQLSEDKKTVTYETETEVPALLRMVNLYPFIKFCVHRQEPLTQIFLCSKDLFLRKSKEKDPQKQRVTVVSKDSFRPQSFVDINGLPAGNQGMIYLDSPSESISMRALLLSGATMEVDTRMKPVNFKDVYLSEDGKEIIVRAQGTEPVDPSTVKKISEENNEWETRLAVERPTTYLKGEGNLPLRQEFIVEGKVRSPDIKVAITSDRENITFKDEYTLQLQTKSGLRLASGDKRTKLEKSDNGQYKWTLTGLQKNETNRRYIKVLTDSDEYIAAYDIERRPSFDGRLQLTAPLWAGASFLYTPSKRWSASLQYDQQFYKALNEPNLHLLTAGLQYRIPPGVHLLDPSYAGEFFAQSFQSDTKSFLLMGLGLQAELRSPRWWSSAFPWTHVKIRYPFSNSDSNFKLKPSYEIEASLRSLFSANHYWDLGIRHYNYKFENAAGDITSTKTLGIVGMGWIF